MLALDRDELRLDDAVRDVSGEYLDYLCGRRYGETSHQWHRSHSITVHRTRLYDEYNVA